MRQARHRHLETLMGYRRHATAFEANVSGEGAYGPKVGLRPAVVSVARAWRNSRLSSAAFVLAPGLSPPPSYCTDRTEISLGRAITTGFLLLTGVGLYAARGTSRTGR